MKFLLSFLLTYMLSLACIANQVDTIESPWELEKNEEGIRVFTKEISGSSFKAFKGEVVINASLTDILANHLDPESMTTWLHDCSASELLTKLSDRSYIVYQRTNAPWPVSDRDYVMKADIDQDSDTYIVKMTFEALAEAEKRSIECVQVTKLRGHWRFTPLGECKVFVEYETHADPAGSLPAWLANSFVVDQPFGTLRKLRQRIQQQDKNQTLGLDFIKNPPNFCST